MWRKQPPLLLAAGIALLLIACQDAGYTHDHGSQGILVAAASNLTSTFDEVGKAFTARTGIPVTYSYGATAQLAQQIENAAPFDVFASADSQHVDDLLRKGLLAPQTRAVYARGQLALWVPKGDALHVRSIPDLANPNIRFIAIAKPGVAPYGQAAVEALQSLKVWQRVQPKVVYASNISMAKQFALTGNADAAFTAYSLVLKEKGTILSIDEKLHAPLDQALGILKSSQDAASAARFTAFVLGKEGRDILARNGYKLP